MGFGQSEISSIDRAAPDLDNEDISLPRLGEGASETRIVCQVLTWLNRCLRRVMNKRNEAITRRYAIAPC